MQSAFQFCVFDDQRPSGLGQHIGVDLLITPGVRVWNKDSRQAKPGIFTQDGGSCAGDSQVGHGQRCAHLGVQIREGVVAFQKFLGQLPYSGLGTSPLTASALLLANNQSHTIMLP